MFAPPFSTDLTYFQRLPYVPTRPYQTMIPEEHSIPLSDGIAGPPRQLLARWEAVLGHVRRCHLPLTTISSIIGGIATAATAMQPTSTDRGYVLPLPHRGRALYSSRCRADLG